jgi:hypothetical protein
MLHRALEIGEQRARVDAPAVARGHALERGTRGRDGRVDRRHVADRGDFGHDVRQHAVRVVRPQRHGIAQARAGELSQHAGAEPPAPAVGQCASQGVIDVGRHAQLSRGDAERLLLGADAQAAQPGCDREAMDPLPRGLDPEPTDVHAADANARRELVGAAVVIQRGRTDGERGDSGAREQYAAGNPASAREAHADKLMASARIWRPRIVLHECLRAVVLSP